MSGPLRLHALGEHAERVRDRLTALTGAELVEDLDRAELVVVTPEDLAELIEDAAAIVLITLPATRSACRSASSTG